MSRICLGTSSLESADRGCVCPSIPSLVLTVLLLIPFSASAEDESQSNLGPIFTPTPSVFEELFDRHLLDTLLAPYPSIVTPRGAAQASGGQAAGAGGPEWDTDTDVGFTTSGDGTLETISNPLTVKASAFAEQGELDISLNGDAAADSSASALASALGVEGSENRDVVDNATTIDVTSTATARVSNVTLNIQDTASAKVTVDADPNATGMAGYDGDDELTNSGTLNVKAIGWVESGEEEITLYDVTGGQVDVTLIARADAVGIDGRQGNDLLVNSGTLDVLAEATAINSTFNYNVIGNASADAEVLSGAKATGIEGGSGIDDIRNQAKITVVASALSAREGESNALVQGFSIVDADAVSQARAVGIDGGSNDDLITNAAMSTLDVSAYASTFTGLSSVKPVALDPLIPLEEAVIEWSPLSISEATGIDGGSGNDTIDNFGSITVTADLPPELGGIETRVLEIDGAVLGNARAVAAARAFGTAIGIEGGDGDDVITNHAHATVRATARPGVEVITGAVGVDLVPLIPSILVGANGNAVAAGHATGISGGDGNDTITNNGSVFAISEASMLSVEVQAKLGLSISSGGDNGGGGEAVASSSAASASAPSDLAASDTSVETILPPQATMATSRISDSIGISGGAGVDTITNRTLIASSATSRGTEVSATATGSIPILVGTASQPAEAAASASTLPESQVTVGAAVEATVGAAVEPPQAGASGIVTIDNWWPDWMLEIPTDWLPREFHDLLFGGDEDEAPSDTATAVNARALGIDGGSGDDTITNLDTGRIVASADAGAKDIKGKVNIAIPTSVLGFLSVVSTMDASSSVDARASGIEGGTGNDTIKNYGEIIALANGNALAITAQLNDQVLIPVPIVLDIRADANTDVRAIAVGIHGDRSDPDASGGGEDVLINHGIVDVEAQADAVSVSGSLFLGGVALGSVYSRAESLGIGVAGGEGNDTVRNDISVKVLSEASITDVAVQGTAILGAGISFADSHATAVALGLDGGEGNDDIDNDGVIEATANAKSQVTLVNLEIGAGVTLGDAGSRATALSVGINGGDGDDDIDSLGKVTSIADARVDVDSWAVTILGASFVTDDFGVTADATAIGIDGDEGTDTITWLDLIDVDATSHVDTNMIAATVGGASFGFSDTTSQAIAIGVVGREGRDTLTGQGALEVDAVATGGTLEVEVSGLGFTQGHLGALVTSEATGIDGGDGADVIVIEDLITVLADTDTGSEDASSGGVSVDLLGMAMQYAEVNVDATAAGARGGLGDDSITNASTVQATADAETHDTAVVVNGVGGTGSNISNATTATSVGLSGGSDRDTIVNSRIGSLLAKATARSNAVNVQVDLTVGTSVGDVSSTANANATGIAGDEDDDIVVNQSSITASADATVTVVSVNVAAIGGKASVDASGSQANASATGIDGGSGNDEITSEGIINVDATSGAGATMISYASLGGALNDAGLTSRATAIGIAGGAGEDDITVGDGIFADAVATSGSTSVDVSILGEAIVDSQTSVSAGAIAVEGGEGKDTILIEQDVWSTARAETTDEGVAVSLIGEGSHIARIYVTARAAGASGGDGIDRIDNAALIVASAEASGTSKHSLVDLFGESTADAGISPTAISMGLEGGDGNDQLLNRGVIDGDARAELEIADSGFTLGGETIVGTADASNLARAFATGIDGGAGSDTLRNENLMEIDSYSSLEAGGGNSVNIFGPSSIGAEFAAKADATGIEGGAGNDSLVNSSTMDVESNALANLGDGSAFTFIGTASEVATLNADAIATGLAGGSGINWIDNDDSATVSATSTMTVEAKSDVAFGTAHASPKTNATSTGIGIQSGDEVDFIHNRGELLVSSTATTSSTSASFAFGGNPSSEAVLASGSTAVGILAGDGSDRITNHESASIRVEPTSSLNATGGTAAVFNFGATLVKGNVASIIDASGIDGGRGDDRIVNAGLLEILPSTSASSRNSSAAGIIFGDTGADAMATSSMSVAGVRAGAGNDEVFNLGTIRAELAAESSAPTVKAWTHSYGPDFTLHSNAISTSTADLPSADFVGISAEGGESQMTNTGLVSLVNSPIVDAESIARGKGVDGHGTGTATADAGSVTSPVSAAAIDVGDGDAQITNRGTLSVEASPQSLATSDVTGTAGGNAIATSEARVYAHAAGIRTGTGDDVIANHGPIVVSAAPVATASAKVGGFWQGPSTLTENATAHSESVGIEAGDGANEILNSAVIHATAGATATSRTFSSVQARATGIRAGDGGNEIVNTGDIHAEADVTAQTATTSEAVVTATAIETGSGNDRIVNAGQGSLRATLRTVAGAGVGIDAGAGDDEVQLLDDSSIGGSVRLGEGDDVISFADRASIAGPILGEAGVDTLRLTEGRGLALASADLSSVERLEIDGGLLELDGDYVLASGGRLQTEITKEGHGEVRVDGDATIAADSELIVTAQPRGFRNGEIFDLLVGDSVTGTFANENVETSRFLNFDVLYHPSAVQLESVVLPFRSAATSPYAASVSSYLDRVPPIASDDLMDVIGELQLLSDQRRIDTAFSTLGPQVYDSSTRASIQIAREMSWLLNRRIQSRRGGAKRDTREARLSAAPLMPMSALAGGVAREPGETDSQRFDTWGTGIGLWGKQDEKAGLAGFDYDAAGAALGLDYHFNDELLGGFSLGYTGSRVDLDADQGRADIDSLYASLYGSWSSRSYWVDGTFSYARQWYDNRRSVIVGGIDRTAYSDHNGNLISTSLAGGTSIGLGRHWSLDPWAGLYYLHLDEDSFVERGAAGVNLLADGRNTDALLTTLGLRVASEFEHGRTRFQPYLGAGWVHDYDVGDRSIVVGFEGAPGSAFSVEGLRLEPNRARIEAGVGVSRKNARLSLEYAGEFASGYRLNGVFGSIRIAF